MKLTAIIYGDNDEEIFVEGFHIAGYRGSRDKYGAPLEPDVEDSIVDIEACDTDGGEIYLEGEKKKEAEEALWETL